MRTKERQFGAIPEWAKTGPIDGRNYCYRAEAHCARKTVERQGLHPTIERGSDEFKLWLEYFDRHLRQRPVVFQALIDGDVREFTVPEARPMWFDPSFIPDLGFVPNTKFDPNIEAARARRRMAVA